MASLSLANRAQICNSRYSSIEIELSDDPTTLSISTTTSKSPRWYVDILFNRCTQSLSLDVLFDGLDMTAALDETETEMEKWL
jgi:hypothetical protein